jgi:hypothetical protein
MGRRVVLILEEEEREVLVDILRREVDDYKEFIEHNPDENDNEDHKVVLEISERILDRAGNL